MSQEKLKLLYNHTISVKNPVKTNFTLVHSSKDEPKADINPPLFIN